MTAAQYSGPSSVGCSVTSVIHKRFRASTVKRRLTRSELGSAAGVADGAAAASAPVQALGAGLAHQPGDPLAVDRQAKAEGQFGVLWEDVLPGEEGSRPFEGFIFQLQPALLPAELGEFLLFRAGR